MKNLLKQEKGISLISLAITIIILGIITSIIVYNVKDTKHTEALTKMYTDIENLNDKIASYYKTYGNIPAYSTEKCSINGALLANLENAQGANDTEVFLVIDLSAIENLTLNYGKGYEILLNELSENEQYTLNETSDKDIYIINENSHNIFYLEGVTIEGKTYYTNQDKDTEKVVLNSDVEYTEDNEKAWSPVYDKETIYKDKNGDTAYIPKGFKVSKIPSMNVIDNGLVVKDANKNENENENENEYVWIPVPKSIVENCATTSQVENALKEYTKEYSDDKFTDEWYDGCGINDTNDSTGSNQYDLLKQKVLQSIKDNYGFYISRYEIGDSTATQNNQARTNDSMISGIAVSKKDQIPYTYVTCSEAQELATGMVNENSGRKSSLLFGIQWNLVCKFIERNGHLDISDSEQTDNKIMNNGELWGNYLDSTFNITSKNAKQFNKSTNAWTNIKEGETKLENKVILLTTGASKQNSMLNIYNFAGNVRELTLEKCSNGEYPNEITTMRGGVYTNPGGNSDPPTLHLGREVSIKSRYVGFRTMIY